MKARKERLRRRINRKQDAARIRYRDSLIDFFAGGFNKLIISAKAAEKVTGAVREYKNADEASNKLKRVVGILGKMMSLINKCSTAIIGATKAIKPIKF